MTSLPVFLLARLDEDEAAAREAIDPERPGTHWRWFNDDDTPSVPDDDTGGEYLTWTTSLRTVEEFPTDVVGNLPAFLINTAEEVRTGAGLHITRHDPARVLADVEAKRRIVEHHAPLPDEFDLCAICTEVGPEAQLWPCYTLRLLALPFADHPDYRAEWAL